jgi:Ca-activated chloride channel family protein
MIFSSPLFRFLSLLLLFNIFYIKSIGQSVFKDSCIGQELDLYRVLFIVDASYSMDRKWGKQTLWEVSQKMVQEFAFHIQKNYNVEMGLRVYGHQFPLNANNCFDSKLEVDIGKNHAQRIVQKLKQTQFKGTTPLSYSLEKAAEDLGCNSHKNLIILITDGFESCNQNPCDVVEKLLDYRIAVKPIVIGLNLDQKEAEHMQCIGDFYSVKSKEAFKKDLYESFDKAIKRRYLQVFLKNKNKITSHTGVPFTILDSKSQFIGNYIHSLNRMMIPDTFSIGDNDTIQILLHTKPPQSFKNIVLKKHIINTIELPCPVGNLSIPLDINPLSPINDKVEAVIWKKDTPVFKNTLPFETELLEGDYQIDILTNPIQNIDFKINANDKHTLKHTIFGIVGFTKNYPMQAEVFKYEGKSLRKIATLQSNKSFERLYLPKGKYKVLYKSQKSITQYGSFDKDFEVNGNDQISIVL